MRRGSERNWKRSAAHDSEGWEAMTAPEKGCKREAGRTAGEEEGFFEGFLCLKEGSGEKATCLNPASGCMGWKVSRPVRSMVRRQPGGTGVGVGEKA